MGAFYEVVKRVHVNAFRKAGRATKCFGAQQRWRQAPPLTEAGRAWRYEGWGQLPRKSDR